MRWNLLTLSLILVTTIVAGPGATRTNAQVRTTYIPSSVVYLIDVTPRRSHTRSVQPPPYNPIFDGGQPACAPLCSTTTPGYGSAPSGYGVANQYVRWVALDRVKMENLTCLTKLRASLQGGEYQRYAKRADALPDAQSTKLRELILALPSRMEGTTYVPPSTESVWAALEQAENL